MYNNNLSTTIGLNETAQLLGVSSDTIRNWVKLRKLTPISTTPITFDKDYVLGYNKQLEDEGKLLSRRNKSRKSDNFIPKSYISSKSPNFKAICGFICEIENDITDISKILGCFARSLLLERGIPKAIADRLLYDFREGLEASNNDYHLTYVEGEDTLGMLYLSIRKMQDKKARGAYYTPFFVVDRMVADLNGITELNRAQILDPACGTGNFLLRLPCDVPVENIHGFDVDPVAVGIARINIALKYRIDSTEELDTLFNNISVLDYLMTGDGFTGNGYEQLSLFKEYEPDENIISYQKYDVIIGNPPWGYSFSKQEINALKAKYLCCRSVSKPESFDVFIEKSLLTAKKNGIISFLLPETILEADIHTDIRNLIIQKADIMSLHYLGDVFDNVQCPCIILTMKGSTETESKETHVFFEKRSGDSLKETASFVSHSPSVSSSSFHILADDYEQKLLDRIRDTQHFTLKDNAVFALGIVTGDNKNLLSDTMSEGFEPIVKGKDIEKFRINTVSSYIEFMPEKFQQCAKTEVYRAKSKLLYRFIADRPVVAHGKNGILTLNSANILIPNVPDYSHEYIMALLNSSILAYYYMKSFRSLKVLRSSLESLPLAVCSSTQMDEITELVCRIEALSLSEKDLLSSDTGNLAVSEAETLKSELDKRIAALYGIETSDFSYILSKL